MNSRSLFRRIVLAACTFAASLVSFHARAADANKACALVTPPELETALGDKVTLEPQTATETAAICSGTTPKARVMLRVATKRGGSGSAGAAKAGVEMARKQGYQVDVKTFGPITCSAMIPPESLAAHGFNTTCSVTKDTSVAAIEITAKTKSDMISIERLKPVAEKMAGRF
jgi:hypothetical protein